MTKLQWKRYFLVLTALVILRAADLTLTFIYTPDLSNEWNPVVSHFNAAWLGMLVIQFLILSMVGALLYFYFTYKGIAMPANLAYNDFVHVYFYGKLQTGLKKVFSIPRNLRGLLALNGFVLTAVALGVSVFAVAHNCLMLNGVRPYVEFVNRHYNLYFPIVYLGMAAMATYGFLYGEYRTYQRNSAPGDRR